MQWALLPLLFAEPRCGDSCEGVSLLALRKQPTEALQPTAPDLYLKGDFDYPCAVDFQWQWPTGIGDALWKMTYIVKLARAYGCAAVVPPPWQMLNSDLNEAGAPHVDHAWFWDRYARVPACMLTALPESLSLTETELLDAIPSKELMDSISEASGKVAVVSLRFSDHFDPFPGFYNPLPGGKPLKDQLGELIASGKRDPGFEYFEKPELVATKATEIMETLPEGAMMGLHLRRGDRVHATESDPADWTYGPHCSDVENVLRAVDLYRNQTEACAAATNIFVATDSNVAEYNNALREGLQNRFKAVHFEQDFWQLDLGDNYLTFFIDEQILSSAVCMVRFRPQNEELLAQVCPDVVQFH